MAWTVEGLDLPGLGRLAAALAVAVRPGDTITLRGDLGAGKTTLARLLIGHLGAGQEEVPSPSYALVQAYDTARMTVTHVDAYRLGMPEEARELGIEEALANGLVVVEWPQRLAHALPADRLDILIEEGDEEDRRDVTLSGHGRWQPRLQRLRAMLGFLEASGWGKAQLAYLQGDASARAYARARQATHSVILMDAPRQPDGPPIRDGRPYSAIAHLAEDVRPFAAVAGSLRQAGLSAPAIMAQDFEAGFLLLEDFGDRVFARAIAEGADMAALYETAVEALLVLRRVQPPPLLPLPGGGTYALPSYDAEALGIETELLLDWFWPALRGAPPGPEVRSEYGALWQEQFERLVARPEGWVLRDYHSPNLMWLAERAGVRRVGILDFQDALRGPLAYDLVSLLQDARLDVPAGLEAALRARYRERAAAEDRGFDRERFDTDYAVLGAQRASKVLGIFARLARRDGKRAYLGHLPRVSGYLERNLQHPALARLKAWYDRHLSAEARAGPLAA